MKLKKELVDEVIRVNKKRRKKMKLDKRLVNNVIRINKKYFRTSDTDLLPALFKAEDKLEQDGKTTHYVVDLIGDLARFTQRSGKGTYEDIYKALAVFGIIVEDKELENES